MGSHLRLTGNISKIYPFFVYCHPCLCTAGGGGGLWLQGRWLSSVVIHSEPCDGEDPKAKSVYHLTDERKESTNAQQHRYSSRLGEN